MDTSTPDKNGIRVFMNRKLISYRSNQQGNTKKCYVFNKSTIVLLFFFWLKDMNVWLVNDIEILKKYKVWENTQFAKFNRYFIT